MTDKLLRARWAVSLVFAVNGATFATWLARVPAVQARLGLSTGELAVGLFGLAMGSVLALLGAGALLTKIGSRAGVLAGAVLLCAGLPLVALAPDLALFVAALVVLGVGNSVLDVSMNAHAARVEQGYGRPICGFVAEGAVNSWSAVYLVDVTAATPALASLGYFSFSMTMIAMRLVADRIVVRIGTVLFIRAITVLAIVGFALVIVVPLPMAGVAGFAVVGLGVAGIVPIAWSIASRKQAHSPGQAVAAVAACGYAGFLVEPVLIGALAHGIGLHWALGCAAVLAACVFFLAPTMRIRDAPAARRQLGCAS